MDGLPSAVRVRGGMAAAVSALLAVVQAGAAPDLRLVFENKCDYPVRYTWDQNVAGNVLMLYNEKVTGTAELNVQTVSWTGGRIYVSHAVDGDGGVDWPTVPAAELQTVLGLLANGQSAQVKSQYSAYVHPGEPRVSAGSIAPPGQLIEFTVVHSGTYNLYDADISNVFYFTEAVNVDMMYENGFGAIDSTNCRNTSNKVAPTQLGCESGGGFWIEYPSTGSGPPGQCKSPNLGCLHDTTSAVCNQYNTELAPLYKFLVANGAAVGYYPALTGITDTTRMYTCDGFTDNPSTGLFLSAMCSAINRGQCDMPTAANLANIASFKNWTGTFCGLHQFYAKDMSSWFQYNVHNPWAKYLRNTLGSSGYSFAQDEGPLGGNVQCRDGAQGWQAPTGMKLTACPGAKPPPSPTCKVGDPVLCPGTNYFCAGNQCCHDGSTCPSASNDYKACAEAKKADCTSQVQHCNVGDSVPCPGGKTGNCMGDQCCADGSTCPSADVDFKGCAKPKTEDCTTAGAASNLWNQTAAVFV